MSSIELRGLEVSQGCWDAMCSLNLIYVKVKAIVLTKERNTINMQPALAGKSAVPAPGSERDPTAARETLRCSLGKHSQDEDVWGLFIIIFIFPLLSPPLFRREKAAALRFAEHLRGSGAASARWLLGPAAEPQRWGSVPPSVPPSALSQPARFLCRNLTLGPSAISIPPACSGAKSCKPQQSPLWLWVYLS